MKPSTSISDAVGNWILFHAVNLPKELIGSTTGIYEPKGWIKAKLRGVDDWGIWLENPYLRITHLVDGQNNPIPPEVQKEITKTASVLIKWQFIASIVRIETDENELERPSLGFRSLGQRPASETKRGR